jgi:hypothetical protein
MANEGRSVPAHVRRPTPEPPSTISERKESFHVRRRQGQLADKVYSGFTASSTAHDGQETTLVALYNTIYHFGGIVAAPGYTEPIKFVEGNPYGTSHVTGQGKIRSGTRPGRRLPTRALGSPGSQPRSRPDSSSEAVLLRNHRRQGRERLLWHPGTMTSPGADRRGPQEAVFHI